MLIKRSANLLRDWLSQFSRLSILIPTHPNTTNASDTFSSAKLLATVECHHWDSVSRCHFGKAILRPKPDNKFTRSSSHQSTNRPHIRFLCDSQKQKTRYLYIYRNRHSLDSSFEQDALLRWLHCALSIADHEMCEFPREYASQIVSTSLFVCRCRSLLFFNLHIAIRMNNRDFFLTLRKMLVSTSMNNEYVD